MHFIASYLDKHLCMSFSSTYVTEEVLKTAYLLEKSLVTNCSTKLRGESPAYALPNS
jgi:hypothetical protein